MKKKILVSGSLVVAVLILCISLKVLADPHEADCEPKESVGTDVTKTDDTTTDTKYIDYTGKEEYSIPLSGGETLTITTVDDITGKTTEVSICPTQEGCDKLRAAGYQGEMMLASDYGFTGTNIQDIAQEFYEIMSSIAADGKNMNLSSDVAYNFYKQMTGLDYSKEQLSKYVTDLNKENGHVGTGKMKGQQVVEHWGQLELANDESRTYWYTKKFTKDTEEVEVDFSDRGSICKGEDCDNDDPPYDDVDPSVIDFTVEAETCSPSFRPISLQPKPQPSGRTVGGTCGSTYQKTEYDYSQTIACGLAVIKNTKVTTMNLPTIKSLVYAGYGFDWTKYTTTINTSSEVYDTTRLTVEYVNATARMTSIAQAIECNKEKKTQVQNEYFEGLKAMREHLTALEGAYKGCVTGNKYCSEHPESNCQQTTNCNSYNEAITEQQNKMNEAYEEYQEDIEKYDRIIEGLAADLELATAELQEIITCGEEIQGFTGQSSTTSYESSVSRGYMELSAPRENYEYRQDINTIRGIEKNSGRALTISDIDELKNAGNENYILINTNHFVPYSVKNGTTGLVHASIEGMSDYSCPINVSNNIICRDDECDDNGTLNLIYRPISLTNPFPNIKNLDSDRKYGSNWSKALSDLIIENNRSVKNYEVYNLTPLYTIVLTPSDIKEIRAYNKTNSFNDFDMECTGSYNCKSNFLWKNFNEIINTSQSCASEGGWDVNCYRGGVSE